MAKVVAIDYTRSLSVGEVAKRSGVAVSTIHFYESKGLIKATRSEGNQRRFSGIVLRYIAIIKVAQRWHTAGRDPRRAGRAAAGQQTTAAQWKSLSARWRQTLDERIKRLTRLRDELDNCIGCGCLSLQDCPLRNPNDALAAEGPGPRILERP